MKLRSCLFVGAALMLGGCIDGRGDDSAGKDDSQPDEIRRVGETGIAVQTVVDQKLDMDVALVQYGIQRAACTAGEQYEAVSKKIRVNLESIVLPAGVPAWDNSHLDKDAQHSFADHFEVLPAGCYDITTAPLTTAGDQSQDCASALTNGVKVQDGYTTEVFAILQCKGAPVGSLDAVVAINRPPSLEGLTFSPSKFISQGEKTTVCATALDPNADPIEFEWAQIEGAAGATATISAGRAGTPAAGQAMLSGSATQCVDINPPAIGNYMFEVRMFDQIRDANNNLIRVEGWLRDHGYPNRSHSSLRFPVYVGAKAGAPAAPAAAAVP